jgi:hypothetical protein
MTQRSTARKRRADGELGEEGGLYRRGPNSERYLEGICAAKPEHFNLTWPTDRSKLVANNVLLAIKRLGRPTMYELEVDTGLNSERLGTALAQLTLWDKTVAAAGDGAARVYFIKQGVKQ